MMSLPYLQAVVVMLTRDVGKVVAKSSGGDKDAIIASMVVTNTSLYALSLHALLLRFDLTLQGTGTLLVQQGRIGTSITAAVSVTPDEKLVLVSAHNTLGRSVKLWGDRALLTSTIVATYMLSQSSEL